MVGIDARRRQQLPYGDVERIGDAADDRQLWVGKALLDLVERGSRDASHVREHRLAQLLGCAEAFDVVPQDHRFFQGERFMSGHGLSMLPCETHPQIVNGCLQCVVNGRLRFQV
nr:hypothetical protein [Adlercreutzia murintestinalis]